MVDTTSGLIPVNTGFTLKSCRTCPASILVSSEIRLLILILFFLECLIKNKCRLMIQELSCRNYLCPL